MSQHVALLFNLGVLKKLFAGFGGGRAIALNPVAIRRSTVNKIILRTDKTVVNWKLVIIMSLELLYLALSKT